MLIQLIIGLVRLHDLFRAFGQVDDAAFRFRLIDCPPLALVVEPIVYLLYMIVR